MFWKTLYMVKYLVVAIMETSAFLQQYIKEWLHFRQLAGRFPGPPSLPLLGHLLEGGFPISPDKLMDTLTERAIEYGVGQLWLGPLRIIVLNRPADIQCYLQNVKNQSKPALYNMVRDVMGDGLITANGHRWRLHHNIIFPTFHPDHIETFESTVNKKCDVFLKILRQHAGGQSFDMKQITYHLTYDVIVETIIGVTSNQQAHPDPHLFDMIEQGQRALRHRCFKPWLIPTTIFQLSSWGIQMAEAMKTGRDNMSKLIQQRMQIVREKRGVESEGEEVKSGKKKMVYGVVDAMLRRMENGASITMDDIEKEAITFLLAGFDTMAATVQLALYCLARNTHMQDKIILELRTIFGKDGPKEVTSDALRQMQYLEMVVKETLRLFSPVWFVLRETGVDTPLASCDLVVPKGCTVVMLQRSLHLDPELYPKPEVFDPERFSPEECAQRHPFAFLPFMGGVRGCIGKSFAMMEAKIILAKVLWHYEVLPEPSYTPSLKWGISIISENGTWIKIVERR